jgi:hypothetical protein
MNRAPPPKDGASRFTLFPFKMNDRAVQHFAGIRVEYRVMADREYIQQKRFVLLDLFIDLPLQLFQIMRLEKLDFSTDNV